MAHKNLPFQFRNHVTDCSEQNAIGSRNHEATVTVNCTAYKINPLPTSASCLATTVKGHACVKAATSMT